MSILHKAAETTRNKKNCISIKRSLLIYSLTPISITDEEEIEPLKESSEEEDIRGGKPEFLQFMSERILQSSL